MPWIVVKFPNTNEVEAIPIKWYNSEDNNIYYPTHLSKHVLEKAIKSEFDPDPNSWELFDVELLRPHPYDTFISACAKASKACITSDISDGDCLPTKRIPKTKRIESSSEESYEEDLPDIPEFPIKGLSLVYLSKWSRFS